jgi:hypothetical protein
MSVSSAPTTVDRSGQIVATGLPTEIKGIASNMPGGLLNAAAAKTAGSITEQASQAKAAGVTMKGSGRKYTSSGRKYKGGGTVINVPQVAEGGSVPGVSFAQNHANLIGIANQLKAGSVYDGLIHAQPYKIGGSRKHPRLLKHTRRRHYIPEKPTTYGNEPVLTAGRKHTRKTKKHVRRSKHRSLRRKLRKFVRRSRRSSSRNIKK